MLLGQDPLTGEQLVGGRGSAQRATSLGRQEAEVSADGDTDELLTPSQAATLLGVSSRYLRRLANRTAKVRTEAAEQKQTAVEA